MTSNITQSPISTFSSIQEYIRTHGSPRPHVINYHLADPAIHYEDGFRDYVAPAFDPATHRLGELIYDEVSDTVTRQVIAKTPEELESERLAQIPYEIKPSQGKIQLHRMGLLDNVNTMIEQLNDTELTLFWEYALTWERNNSYIQTLANQIGMNETDIENFFINASQIH